MKPLDAAELRAVLEESALSPALTAQVLETLAHTERERDLAVAHDRQPYPTAEAYDHVRALLADERAKVARLREAARCHTCGKQATCVGAYEGREPAEFGCDDCCGHGNEDGWCEHFDDDEPPALLAPQPPPTRTANSVEVWPSLLAKYGDAMGPKLRALCEARNLQGIAKYGVALTTFNGRDAKTDALQEKIDGIAYDGQDELTEEALEPRSRLALMAEERVYRSILAADDVMCAQHIAAERDAKGGGQ